MHRTLLLCFIHGFKGGDDTFGRFPQHLTALVSHALPSITVKCIVYPQFETRGDLYECVSRFREWLQNKVIDFEVAAATPSPTVDPSVHVILVGHSMGGIVAAETLLAIVGDEPVKSQSSSTASVTTPSVPANSNSSATTTNFPPKLPPKQSTGGANSKVSAEDKTRVPESRPASDAASPGFMFPYITGILAFDTPYLGISPGVIAHGAESQYQTASSAYSALSTAASAFGWGSSSETTPGPPKTRTSTKKLPANAASAGEALKASADAAAAPAWQSWGRYAMFAGAAGAVIAGGAAAYRNRDSMKEGWGWVGSHLEFVGCLVRGEELKHRMNKVIRLSKSRGIGFLDIITVLGEGAVQIEGTTVAGGWVEIGEGIGNLEARRRTFCKLPQDEDWKSFFEETTNDKMVGEIQAHCAMFFPKDNPGYYDMGEKAKENVVQWVGGAWYQGSSPVLEETSQGKGARWETRSDQDDDPVLVD